MREAVRMSRSEVRRERVWCRWVRWSSMLGVGVVRLLLWFWGEVREAEVELWGVEADGRGGSGGWGEDVGDVVGDDEAGVEEMGEAGGEGVELPVGW